MSVGSILKKYLAYEGKVAITVIESTQIVEEARKIHDLTPTTTAALGRLLTATALLGSDLKNETDSISAQIKGNGPIGSMVAVSDSLPRVRAYIQNPHIELPLNQNGKIDVGGAVGKNGYLNIINDIGNTDTIEQTRNMLNLINEKIININNYFIVINPITNLLIEKNIFKIIFYLIKLILINLIGLIIFIFFGNKIYLKQLLKNNYYEKNNKNKKINLKNKLKKNNKNIAYIKKEIKNIFKNPAFFLQQIYPVILTTILSCILIIIITPKFIQFLNIEENKNLLENLSLDIEAICLILGLTQFVGLFNYSSITAFSREGSDAYIIKLLPISLYKQFIYKNIPQILINTISTILILGTLYFNISGLQNNYIFIIFILAFLLNIINSFILTFIDLINPKINWKYEYEILQNNKNKLFQYSLIILNILFLIYIKNIFNNFNLNKSLIIFAILLIFILLIINLIINKNNKKLFKKIK